MEADRDRGQSRRGMAMAADGSGWGWVGGFPYAAQGREAGHGWRRVGFWLLMLAARVRGLLVPVSD